MSKAIKPNVPNQYSADAMAKAELSRLAQPPPTQTGYIGTWFGTSHGGSYLLIDFGFTGSYFYPNSIQFYDNTGAFMCYKTTNATDFPSLVPILNCDGIQLMWNTTSHEAVYINGWKSKP